MDELHITGGNRLDGAVPISGAKNAALPQIAAALLSPHPLELTNLPKVSDVENMLRIISQYGAEVRHDAAGTTINAAHVTPGEVDYETVRKMRASILVLAPLLSRFGSARVSLPGGCAIGARPVDMHLKVPDGTRCHSLRRGWLYRCLHEWRSEGARIVLSGPSVGATETRAHGCLLCQGRDGNSERRA